MSVLWELCLAELFVILSACEWFEASCDSVCLICSDSLSGLLALSNTEHTNFLVQEIQQLLIKSQKSFFFMWVKGHSGVLGNENADRLAKNATDNLAQAPPFLPLPPSNLKYKLRQELLEEWQNRWDYSEVGRYTFNFFPKISTERLIYNRYLYLFLTNHGPFQSHRYQIGVSDSPNCICGKYSTSLHYILDCDLTSTFHTKKNSEQTYSNWINYVLERPVFVRRMVECVQFLEKNEFLFRPLIAPLIPF